MTTNSGSSCSSSNQQQQPSEIYQFIESFNENPDFFLDFETSENNHKLLADPGRPVKPKNRSLHKRKYNSTSLLKKSLNFQTAPPPPPPTTTTTTQPIQIKDVTLLDHRQNQDLSFHTVSRHLQNLQHFL